MSENEHTGGLPRRFGFWTGFWVVVASMVGTGILVTSGRILLETQNLWTLLGLWVVGGALSLAGALTLAEPACALPHVGGDYVYVREAFGKAFAFVYGWSNVLLSFCAPTAIASLGAIPFLLAPIPSSYVTQVSQWLSPGAAVDDAGASVFLSQILATLVICTFTIVHCLGHDESALTQSLTTAFKSAILLGVGIVGIAWGAGDWSHFANPRPISQQALAPLAAALVMVMYAYTGWNGAVYIAGEIREPGKLIPRTLVGGSLAVIILYLLLNVAYGYALSPADLAQLPEADVKAIGKLAMRALFGRNVEQVLSTLIGVGILASVSAWILTGPRVSFAMARDGLFPAIAGKLHAERQTPVPATLLSGFFSVAMIWIGSFDQILDYASSGLVLLSCFVIASIFPIRRRTDLQFPFRVPLYPFTPIVFLLVSAWMVGSGLLDVSSSLPSYLAILSIAAGFPLYYVLRRFGALT